MDESDFAEVEFTNRSVKERLEKLGWNEHQVRVYQDQKKLFVAGKTKKRDCKKEHWENELLVLEKVGSHKNVVRYFTTCCCNADIGDKKIMELCDGNFEEYLCNKVIMPLRELAEKKIPNIKSAQGYFNGNILDLLHQAAKGLAYLHENDIIHRDIKPSNVLLIQGLRGQTVVKLGGFGLSRLLENYVIENMTSHQTSDENTTNECHKRGSRPSDVFDFAVMSCYALLRTKYPFDKNRRPLEIKTEKAEREKLFKKLREIESYTEEQKITVIDMIKRMICNDPFKRLKADEVEQHPSFYSDQKKISLLLKINDTVRKADVCTVTEIINRYDRGLTEDFKDGRTKRFKIIQTKIFKNYPYFIKNKDKPGKWEFFMEGNVTSLLKYLRDKVTHACNNPSNVPKQFVRDFDVQNDSYNSSKFLRVFLSQTPQLLVHLYNLYRYEDGVAVNFYPKKYK